MWLVGFKGWNVFHARSSVWLGAGDFNKLICDMHKWHNTDMLWDLKLLSSVLHTTQWHDRQWQYCILSVWEYFFVMHVREQKHQQRQLLWHVPLVFLFFFFKRVQGLGESGQAVRRVQCQHAHEAFRGSDVHVIVLFVWLTLQRWLLAGRLLHLQRRLAQSVLFDCGCRLRRQNDVLYRSRQQGSLLNTELSNSLNSSVHMYAYVHSYIQSLADMFRCKLHTLSLCLVSSEMLPFGERSVGVGGVTVISGGNLVTVEGINSFGMLGGTRERIRLGSGSFDCSLLAYCCWSKREKQEDISKSHNIFKAYESKSCSKCWNIINSIIDSCCDLFSVKLWI